MIPLQRKLRTADCGHSVHGSREERRDWARRRHHEQQAWECGPTKVTCTDLGLLDCVCKQQKIFFLAHSVHRGGSLKGRTQPLAARLHHLFFHHPLPPSRRLAIMSDQLTRIAIISSDKCKPKKCRQECKKSCPVVKMGTFPFPPLFFRFRIRFNHLSPFPFAMHAPTSCPSESCQHCLIT